jgi:DNA-binding protein HU-beta
VTKKDLVAAMADSAGISKAKAEKAFNAFIDGVKGTLAKGDKVTLVGFGTFSVSKRAARKGRNPQTGAEIMIKAAKVPKFTPGKGLKKAI